MDRERIGFKGKKYADDREVVIEVPLYNQFTLVHKNYEAVDLTIDNRVNRFYFKDVKYSCKVNILVEENFRLNHGLPIPDPVKLPAGSEIEWKAPETADD